MIFLDADKENYLTYYQLALGDDKSDKSDKFGGGLLADNGFILADNSLCALLYDGDDMRRQKLHEFNQFVKNDPRVEQVILTVREGISLIRRV